MMDYPEEDYLELENAYIESNLVKNGRPDNYQYYQNQLSQALSKFLLKPYWKEKEKQRK